MRRPSCTSCSFFRWLHRLHHHQKDLRPDNSETNRNPSPARSHFLSTHRNWNVRQLIKEYKVTLWTSSTKFDYFLPIFKKMFLKFNPFSRNCCFLFLVLANSKFSFAGCFPIQLISFLSNYQINKRNKKKQKNLVLESSVIYLLLLCWGRGISYEQHTYHAQSQHTPCSCQLLLWILACSSRKRKCCLVGSRSPG